MSANKNYLIKKYQAPSGNVPFDDWFANLPDQIQARIETRLDRLSLGNFGDCSSIGGGVYELRFFFGPGYRVYFGLLNQTLVLLLCGGNKNSQRKDIRLAQTLWREFKKEKRK